MQPEVRNLYNAKWQETEKPDPDYSKNSSVGQLYAGNDEISGQAVVIKGNVKGSPHLLSTITVYKFCQL